MDKNRSLRRTSKCLMVMAACTALAQFAWALDMPSNFTNTGSIINTRHNLSMEGVAGVSAALHDSSRNRYGEVCVYCHTPHGASQTTAAPLWNRTNKNTTYTLYNIPLTSGQSPTNPGVNSLACLSCHDGQTAIDSIINMPGSGMALSSQATTQNTAFLDSWVTYTTTHRGINSVNNTLGNGTGSDGIGCMACHSPDGLMAFGPGGMGIAEGNDMRVFNIGTDLTNDHPIGVQLPDTNVYDFKAPTGTSGALKFFDTNSNGKPDKSEVRFYNTGGGFEVECASCHDPHGVPSAGTGSVFIPSFLRVSNAGSVLCMTCHDK